MDDSIVSSSILEYCYNKISENTKLLFRDSSGFRKLSSAVQRERG